MEKFIYSVIFLFIWLNVYSQVNPIDICFDQIEPEWIYFSKDSNFVVTQETPSWASEYSNRVFVWAENYKDKVLLFEQNAGPFNAFSGYSLICLNQEDGQEHFVFHDNSHNGLNYNEVYASQFREIEDDFLTIYGYRSDVPHPNNYFVFYNGSPVVKTINLATQELVTTIVGQAPDSILQSSIFSTSANEQHFKNKSGEQIHSRGGGEIINNEAVNFIKFWKTDDNLTVDTSLVRQIQFNTNIPTSTSSLTTTPFRTLLNDSTLVVLNSIKSLPDLNQSPASATLSWWDISSIDSIAKISEFDITSSFPKQQNPYFNLFYKSYGEDLILTQFINQEDEVSGLEQYSWMSWYNKSNGTIAELKFFGNNEKNYSVLKSVSISDDKLVFVAYGSDNSFVYYDVFTLSSHNSEVEQVGSISFKKEEDVNYGPIFKIETLENGLSICHSKFEILQENGDFTRLPVYIAFDFNKFLSSNENQYFPESSFGYNLFPNPAHSTLNLRFDEEFTGNISILDLNGHLMKSSNLSSEQNFSFDISNLTQGEYILKMKNESGSIKSTLFFKM